MTPRDIVFSRADVLQAAVGLVRRSGWESLSARRVAAVLNSSVAPVYSAFANMEELGRAVLQEIRDRLEEYSRRRHSDIPFLNIGVGIVLFARDEANLFRALFHSAHRQWDILQEFHLSVLERMRADAWLGKYSEESRRRLKENIWLYTLGLATTVISGALPAADDAQLVRRLQDMGGVLMYAELAGIGDSEAEECRLRWATLLREKGETPPPVGRCPAADPGPIPKKNKEES